MKLGNKGYSIVEMFAVIFIVSAILFPLISTLVNNIETNARYHNRRSAVSLAQGTIDGFERFDFTQLQTLVNNANSSNDFFVEIDASSCNQLGTDDELLCQELFESTWSNFTADSDDFKVFIINYHLTPAMQTTLVNNTTDIPEAVRNQINTYSTTLDPNPDLYYIIAWVRYDDDTESSIIIEGLISDD